jgi:hypothetical protein
MLLEIGKYLTEMEVPRRFVEIMTDTSSKDMRWLSFEEAKSINDVPSIAEWIALTCGAMSESEKNTMTAIAVEIYWPKDVSQRDRMLYDQLRKRSEEESVCRFRKISRARDAIR